MGKITSWMAADKWVKCYMGGARGGHFSYGYQAQHIWSYGAPDPLFPCDEEHFDDGETVFDDITPTQNIIRIEGQAEAGGAQWASQLTIGLISSGFGAPKPLAFFPDGTQILEAKAEIMSSGLTRFHQWFSAPLNDCDDNQIDPGDDGSSSTLENIQYAVLGFTGPKSYEVIGYVSGAGEGQTIGDVTDIIRVMFAERATGKFFGYGIVVTPDNFDTESLMPGEGPTRQEPVCIGPCQGGSVTRYYTMDKTTLTWGNITFGTIMIKVRYPESERERYGAMMPAIPAMV